MKLIIALFLMASAHAITWFTYNGQFVWEEWSKRPLATALLLGPPATLLFWWSSRYGYQALGSAWSVRFLASFYFDYYYSSLLEITLDIYSLCAILCM
jgi:hypothetical protein